VECASARTERKADSENYFGAGGDPKYYFYHIGNFSFLRFFLKLRILQQNRILVEYGACDKLSNGIFGYFLAASCEAPDSKK
jgi:hypothetical protein